MHYWAGDLELGETGIIYNCNIIIYKIIEENDNFLNLKYYNIYGNINDLSKPIIIN